MVGEQSWKHCGHQMSYFKAKMHQIRFQQGLHPDSVLRELTHSTPPDLLAGFKGSYF